MRLSQVLGARSIVRRSENLFFAGTPRSENNRAGVPILSQHTLEVRQPCSA